MEVINCKKCGALFQYVTGTPICMRCKKIEEDIFQTVKAYLREHRGATVTEVSDVTGASQALIQRFLREGRLEVLPGSPIVLTCEQCGTKIYTGRFCERCQVSMSHEFNRVAKSMEPRFKEVKQEKERMRFLNRNQ